MEKDEITYKDLNKTQLDNLKDIFINSRLKSMSESDLKLFVKSIISDQIKGTVGNEEEREAWNEMKEHFGNNFQDMLKEVIITMKNQDEDLRTPEQIELAKRLKFLEERNKEKDENSIDMW